MTHQQEELVKNNVNLVYKITSYFNVPRDDRSDLIQEGFMALCMAAQRFDATRGEKFGTYAYSYISGRCKYFVSRNALIKPARSKESGYKRFVTYPTYNIEDYLYMPDPESYVEVSELDKVVKAIGSKYGPQVSQVVEMCGIGYTVKEISKQLDIKVSQVQEILNLLKNEPMVCNIIKE